MPGAVGAAIGVAIGGVAETEGGAAFVLCGLGEGSSVELTAFDRGFETGAAAEAVDAFLESVFSDSCSFPVPGDAADFASAGALAGEGFSGLARLAGGFGVPNSAFAGVAFLASCDSLFVVAWPSGAEGTMEAILSFSTKTNPKSVFTLN